MIRDKVKAFIALGSNLGDRMGNLDAAENAFASSRGVYLDTTSPTYESLAADVTDQPKFLNRVLAVEVWLSPRELLEVCMRVESAMGRVRDVAKGPRIIDCDILLFGEEIIKEPDMVIPHAALTARPFFLQPLKDTAGDIFIPGTGLPISKHLAALAPYELSPVKRY